MKNIIQKIKNFFSCKCIIYDRIKSYTQRKDWFSGNCPFCWNLNTGVFFVSDYWIVVKNKYPYPRLKSHLLIIPYRHISKYSEIRKKEREDLHKILSIYFDRSYSIYGRQFPNDWASVEHLHIHLIKK